MPNYYYNDYPVPDLYYDQQELPSPPSATSSNVITTPPLDWQPWNASGSQKSDLMWSLEDPWLLDEHTPQQQQQIPALDPNSILFSSYQQPAPPQSVPSASGTRYVSPAATMLTPSSTTTPAMAASQPSQASLKLHQPRPSRRIPIVSLSKLALACDDFQMRPKEPRELPNHFSGEAGPLPFRTTPSKPYHPMAYYQYNTQYTQPKYDLYGTAFPGNTARLTQCSCGCMTPSTCQ